MPKTARSLPSTYEQDYYAWTVEQAAELRGMAERRVDSRLDLANLAEEVADLGKSERDAVRLQVRRVIEHLLKLQFSAATEARPSRIASIIDARNILDDKLSPSLRRDVAENLDDQYRKARRAAAHGLGTPGEAAAARRLPAAFPYGADQILAPDWYPVPESRD
jgi:Domain of unknown function DUF29